MPRPNHVVPSFDQPNVFVPEPPATQIVPFQAIEFTYVVNVVLPEATAVHVTPVGELNIWCVPAPPAKN